MTELQQFDGWRVLTDEQAELMQQDAVRIWKKMNTLYAGDERGGEWARQEALREIPFISGLGASHVLGCALSSGLRCFCACPKVMSEYEYQSMIGGLIDADDELTPDTLVAALNREIGRASCRERV